MNLLNIKESVLKKRNRIVSLIFCFIFAFCLLVQTGCKSDADNKIEVIRFWHTFTGKQRSIFDLLVDTYNATEGKKRNVIISPEYKSEDFVKKYFNESFGLTEGKYDYPDMAVISNELAYKAKSLNLLVCAEDYLTKQELSGYFDGFIQEGRIAGTDETYVFPLSKSSDVTIINDSIWRRFYNDNNVELNQWKTWNGILSLAERYYEWTGGKALIAIESLEDYIFAYSAQRLPVMIQTGNKEIKINTNKETLRGIWDFYYKGVVNGYILQTDNVVEALKNGEIAAYIGTPHDMSYFPDTYININGEENSLLISASSYPVANETRNVAPHGGTGVCVFDSGEKINKESYAFLHWFCTSENAIQFSTANNEISSYRPLYKKNSTTDYFKQLSVLDYEKYYMMSQSVRQVMEGKTYAPTGFVGYESFCNDLTSSLVKKSADGIAEINILEKNGFSRAEALEKVCDNSNFEGWYFRVIEIANQY